MNILIPAAFALPSLWLLARYCRQPQNSPGFLARWGIALCAAASVCYIAALILLSRFY